MFSNLFNKVKAYISEGHNRSVIIKKNILYSLFIRGFNIVIGLVLVPVVLNYIGNEEYGVWLTINSVLFLTDFLDIGLGKGLRNKFGIAKTQGKYRKAKELVSTSYFLILIISVLLIVILIPLVFLLSWQKILNYTYLEEGYLKLVIGITVVMFAIKFVLKLISQILLADLQTALSNLIVPLSNLFVILLVVFFNWINQRSLLLLALIYTSTSNVMLIGFSIVLFTTRYKNFRPSIAQINLRMIPVLFSLGGKYFYIQLISLITSASINFIIIQLFGASEVTNYQIVIKYFNIPLMLQGIMIMPMWSAFTSAFASNDLEWIKRVLKKLLIVAVGLSFIVVIMYSVSEPVFKIWLGNKVAIKQSLIVGIGVWTIFKVIGSQFTQFILGVGKLGLSIVLGTFRLVGFSVGVFYIYYFRLSIEYLVYLLIILSILATIFELIQTNKIILKKDYGIWTK